VRQEEQFSAWNLCIACRI